MSKATADSALLDPTAAGGPVVVKFTAAYCPPCRLLTPVLNGLAAEYAGRVQVVTVDIEDQPALAQRYGVRSVPTLLAFSGDQVVQQQVGYSNPRRVRELFEALTARVQQVAG